MSRYREDVLERVRIPPIRLSRVRTFKVADYCKVGTKVGNLIIGSINQVFREELSMVVERNVPALEDLKAWRRPDLVSDGGIFQFIGNEQAMFLPLAHIFHVMALGEQAGNLMAGMSNRAFTCLPKEFQDTEEEKKCYEIWWAVLQGQLALAARKVAKDPAKSEPNDWCFVNTLFTG